jgi:hypothetical protein
MMKIMKSQRLIKTCYFYFCSIKNRRVIEVNHFLEEKIFLYIKDVNI